MLEPSLRVDGKRRHATAAVIDLVGAMRGFAGPWYLPGDELPFVDALRILEIERHADLGREPDGQRALRAVDPRIDHSVELELDAELVGEMLHVVQLVDGSVTATVLSASGSCRSRSRSMPRRHFRMSPEYRSDAVGLFRQPVEGDFDREWPPRARWSARSA